MTREEKWEQAMQEARRPPQKADFFAGQVDCFREVANIAQGEARSAIDSLRTYQQAMKMILPYLDTRRDGEGKRLAKAVRVLLGWDYEDDE